MTVPPLAEWLRWISQMPAAFKAVPQGFPSGAVRVRGVVNDLWETLFGQGAPEPLLGACDPRNDSAAERNRLAWTLAACHVLWHPSLRASKELPREGLQRLLVQELPELAAVAKVDALDRDEERREELARRVVRNLGRTFPGESTDEFLAKLGQVDSIERHRILAQAAERERRAREVREAMAKKAAEEAAAKVSRE